MAATSFATGGTETAGAGSCRQHQSPMRRYCEQCSESACDECVIARHSSHGESVVRMTEYAQEVKQSTAELLALASNLPFRRIQFAAERTRRISEKKRDSLTKIVDLKAGLSTADIQNTLGDLDAITHHVARLGISILNNNDVDQGGTSTGEYLQTVDTVLMILNENTPTPSDMNLEFVGMRPDGSVGCFITGGINIIGNAVDGQTVTYIADNRRRDSVIIIGSGYWHSTSVSKWIKSFHVIDRRNRVVFSSQVRPRGEERLLLLALGHTIYKVDTSVGRCISDQIDTVQVREGGVLLEGASSISSIDWFPEDDGLLAVFSLSTAKSMFLIDLETKTLLRSFSTVLTNPSVLSCRKVGTSALTIANDNAHPFKCVVINEKGTIECCFSPSEKIAGYTPWMGCWVAEEATSTKMALVWYKPKSRDWRVMMHDGTGRVVRELDVHGSGSTIPISIAYNPQQKSFAMCSKEGIHHILYNE